MNFENIRILESLLLPPGGLIIFGLLGALFSFTKIGKQLVFICLLLMYLLSTPYISSWMNNRLDKQYPAINPTLLKGAAPPQALVVLGGGYYGESVEYADTTIGPFFAERIRYAAWLSKRSGLPIIVSSGRSDSPAAVRILKEEYGISNVLTEDASWTTDDNVRNLKPLLSSTGINKVGVITHGWHMPRAMWSFNAHGINAQAMPMGLLVKRPRIDKLDSWLPSMTSLMRSRNVMHEFFGLLWYRMNAIRGPQIETSIPLNTESTPLIINESPPTQSELKIEPLPGNNAQ